MTQQLATGFTLSNRTVDPKPHVQQGSINKQSSTMNHAGRFWDRVDEKTWVTDPALP